HLCRAGGDAVGSALGRDIEPAVSGRARATMSGGVMRRLAKVSAAAAATVGVAAVAGLMIGGTDFLRQHLGTLVLAVAMVVGLGTLAWHLVGGLVRGAVLAVRDRKSTRLNSS